MKAMPQSTSLLALVGVVGFALISLLMGILP
jgi:preprotein translocase subunit Sss1